MMHDLQTIVLQLTACTLKSVEDLAENDLSINKKIQQQHVKQEVAKVLRKVCCTVMEITMFSVSSSLYKHDGNNNNSFEYLTGKLYEYKRRRRMRCSLTHRNENRKSHSFDYNTEEKVFGQQSISSSLPSTGSLYRTNSTENSSILSSPHFPLEPSSSSSLHLMAANAPLSPFSKPIVSHPRWLQSKNYSSQGQYEFSLDDRCLASNDNGDDEEDEGKLLLLAEILMRILSRLDVLRREKPNHYGIFDAVVILNEIRFLSSKVSRLLTSASKASNTIKESLCKEVLGAVFWEECFGSLIEVPWADFESAFQMVFGDLESNKEAMDKFRAHLCRQCSKGMSDGKNGDMVQFDTFSSFCINQGSLYDGFLNVSDPGTHIMSLGCIEDNRRSFNTKVELISSLVGIKILQLSCGGEHAAVLTEGSRAYTWGKGEFGRLGHGNNLDAINPLVVKGLPQGTCTKVTCGFAYTVAICSTTDLYSWGAGENGRLGLGDTRDRNAPDKMLLQNNVHVVDVQAGSVHTCLLTAKGEVYACGKHEYTGHGDYVDVLVPKRINYFGSEHVKQISVGPGGYHTIALTDSPNPKVYSWGHNRVGQLGYSNKTSSARGNHFTTHPRCVNITELGKDKVEQVFAGWGHSALITKQGKLFTCGRNFQGQLGIGDPKSLKKNERGHPYQPEFTRVDLDEKPVQVACGGEHTAVLTKQGNIYVFGKGECGQLGLGDTFSKSDPMKMPRNEQQHRKILQVACGNNCTLMLLGSYMVPSLFELSKNIVLQTSDKLSSSFFPDGGKGCNIKAILEYCHLSSEN